jgi:hypothetical protein
VCRQRFRQSARRPSEVALEEELAEAQPEQEGPNAEDIRRALGHLAFNQRAALVMRELEGRSYAEIAEILDVSVSAVETLLFRARRALREQLEDALSCGEAELAISRQLDGRLPRAEKGRLRAHLRECSECATFARSQRAQRSALKSLGAVPLPASLASWLGGGGGAAVGGGIAAKAVLLGAAALVATGVGVEGTRHHMWPTMAPVREAAAKPAEPAKAAKAKPPSAVAPVVHVRATKPLATPKHASPAPRSDVRPLKHVEHENTVRGARASHAQKPIVKDRGREKLVTLPQQAAKQLPTQASQRARSRAHHVPAQHRHVPVKPAKPAHPSAPAQPPKQQAKPQAKPPKQHAQPQQTQTTPTPPQQQDQGNGGDSGQGNGQGKKQH